MMQMTNQTAVASQRHSLPTRALHMGVALAVVWQLGVSLVMQGPRAQQAGDVLFTTHTYVGLATASLLVLFWLNLMLRQRGTEAGALFPWLSSSRRAALFADIRAQFGPLLRFRLPEYADGAPLASAVHGLGLLLMTLMAGTGAAWWALQPNGGNFENVHKLFANLAWVYLIAHAGLALVHHLRREASLGEMWSLRGRN